MLKNIVVASLAGPKFTCTVCGYFGRFKSFGVRPIFHARCPACNSLSRHRLLVLADSSEKIFHENQRLLHFAPEPIITKYLQGRVAKYVTADLHDQEVDLKLNIEAIDLPDGSFDVVLCSHVLEHVDDRKALVEIHRILTADGVMVAMIPIIEGWSKTFEDTSIVEAEERVRFFDQWDHVRVYGADFRDRLRDAGFDIDEFTALGHVAPDYSLQRGEKVFICSKNGDPANASQGNA